MTVRIGVVGVGFGAEVHVPAFQSEGLEVVALMARRRERAADAATKYGIDRVLTDFNELVAMPDLDAVSIVTPPRLHHEMAIAALRAGKHVICEKPFALTNREAKEMYDEAQRTGLTAMVAHEFRFSSGRMRVRQLLDEGYVGQPKLATVRLFRGPTGAVPVPEYRDERDAKEAGAGFLFSPGSHYIDGLRHWFGEVEAVEAHLSVFAPERIDGGVQVAADADDTLSVLLYFASGVVAQLCGSKVAPFSAESTMAVFGSQGTLVTPQEGFNPPSHGEVRGARFGAGDRLQTLPIPAELEPFRDDRDDRMMPFRLFTREFLRGIETGTSPSPSFFDGWRCQQILDAAREASATGQRVTIASS